MSTDHLVFVYGTLKQGEPNHQLLVGGNGRQKLCGPGTTVEPFPLVIAGRYNIPYLLDAPGKGTRIEGELYSVDDEMLANLDRLENIPKHYVRKQVNVEVEMDGKRERKSAWIYILEDFRPDLLQKDLLASYSSSGDHGQAYIPKHERVSNIADFYVDVKTT